MEAEAERGVWRLPLVGREGGIMKKVFLAAGMALAASVAMATTISITSGTADMTLPNGPTLTGQFALFGTGVSFTGAGNTTSGPCHVPVCTGITPIAVNAYIASGDQGLAGTVILDGITTNYALFPDQRGSAGLNLTYTLPAFSTVGNPAAVTLMTPFIGQAGILMQGFNGDQPLIMNGEGIATIELSLAFPSFPDGSPALYRLRSAHYEFVLVPDPGTAVLILIGFIVWSAVTFGRRVIRGS